MTPAQVQQAQRDGAYVQFQQDGAEFVGTIHRLDQHEAEIDIMGYRNDAAGEWRLRVMPRRWVAVDQLEQHRTRWAATQNNVPEDSDQTVRLFGVGDEVETDDGPGTLVAVDFHAAKYHDGWELEPPSLVVELEDGTVIHTCLCSVTLPGTQKGTKLIHKEFDRLWPPRTEDVPQDANMLIPEGDEPEPEPEVREGNERNAQMRNRYDPKKLRRYAELPDEPVRVYIADLGAYNAGKLIGEWIDLPADPEELAALTNKMSRGGRGDWAIHDYEAPFTISEYDDVFALNEAMINVANSYVDFAIVACIKDNLGYTDWDEAIEAAEEATVVEAENDVDLAYSFVDDMGGVAALGKTAQTYFDYEAFGRDVSLELYDEEDRKHYEQFDSDEDYGYDLVENLGWEGVGANNLNQYFDYKKFGRDMAMDYFQCGKYYIRAS